MFGLKLVLVLFHLKYKITNYFMKEFCYDSIMSIIVTLPFSFLHCFIIITLNHICMTV